MARKQRPEAASTFAAPASGSPAEADRRGDQERYELCPAAPAPASEEVADRTHGTCFDLACDIAYHAIREQFFARLNRQLTGIQVLLGTSAVAAMVAAYPGAGASLMAVSAFAGVLLLVIDPAGSARDHRAFRTRIQSVRADIEEAGETEESLRKARAARMRIMGEAPPAFRAISAIAYNTAINSIYPEEAAAGHRYEIGFWKRAVANWLPMRGTLFGKEQVKQDG